MSLDETNKRQNPVGWCWSAAQELRLQMKLIQCTRRNATILLQKKRRPGTIRFFRLPPSFRSPTILVGPPCSSSSLPDAVESRSDDAREAVALESCPFWISAAFVLLLSIIIIMMTDFGSLRPYQTTFFEGCGILRELGQTLESVWRDGVWRKVDGATLHCPNRGAMGICGHLLLVRVHVCV